MKPKISVIVPIYNVEKYLEKCIDSIINQTYSNLEIILVNDGSVDNSKNICDQYAISDKRIKVIHKENGGLSDARNYGLNIATGDYVSFIDSDDYIHPMFYEILWKMIEENEGDIAQCNFTKYYENNDIVNIKNIEFHKQPHILTNIQALDYLTSDLNYIVVWNKLYKIELFDHVRFPKGKLHEDEYTTYKVLFKSKKIIVTSIPLYYYLQRTDSITGQKFNLKKLDALDAFIEQISFYKEKKLYTIKNKTICRFESNLRILMMQVLDSDIEEKEKERIFNQLISVYRENRNLFKEAFKSNKRKRMLLLLYSRGPLFVLKITSRLLYVKHNHNVSTS